MLTLFTTSKDFIGQNRINQINAIKSWLLAPYPVQVIIFERSKGIEVFDNEPNILIEEYVKTSDSGIPVINYMFEKASELSEFPICCFINADIILTQDFFNSILEIHKKAKKNYLVVGQRLDVDVTESIEFEAKWEQKFYITHQESMKVHLPYGSDFFVFPRGQYTQQNLPPMLVGRVTWDNYMIYDARIKHFKLIDLSKSVMVIHQNHDYSHKPIDPSKRKIDEEFNYQFFPDKDWTNYILTYCDYYYENRLKRNYHSGDLDIYYTTSLKFANNSFERIKVKIEVRCLKLLYKLGYKFN